MTSPKGDYGTAVTCLRAIAAGQQGVLTDVEAAALLCKLEEYQWEKSQGWHAALSPSPEQVGPDLGRQRTAEDGGVSSPPDAERPLGGPVITTEREGRG